MPRFVSMKTTRRQRLAKRLTELAPAAERELAKAALKGAQEIIATAKRFVAVEEGGLRDSGHARLEARGDARVRAIAGFAAPHAHMVEFGTADRRHASGKSTGRAPAQPFLFPAYRLLKKRTTSRLSRAINKSIKDIAKK